ncbi:MAG: signal recognition particle protein, partial [Oscillospiraceae bacterium]|nr:signal recognition particle protein [Oscillospiraceae bacterium]
FTLTDFYDQLTQLKGMGSMQDILSMMPGVDAKALSGATLDEKALSRTEAILLSMTPKERENPDIIGSSRKKRIAAGSGTTVVDVNRLLRQFDAMCKLMKQMNGMSGKKMKRMQKMGGFPGMPPGFGL